MRLHQQFLASRDLSLEAVNDRCTSLPTFTRQYLLLQRNRSLAIEVEWQNVIRLSSGGRVWGY